MSPWPNCLRQCLQIRRLWFDSPLFLFSFYFAHAQCGYQACPLAFSDVIILTHMDFDIQVDNLGCDSRLFEVLRARPWLPLWGTESWPAGAPWVTGFPAEGGNRLYSDGELVNVLSEKGKEDYRNPWRYLRPTLGGNRGLTLGPRPGALFLRQNARRASAPQNGRLPHREEYQSGTPNCGRAHLPWETVESTKQEKEKGKRAQKKFRRAK